MGYVTTDNVVKLQLEKQPNGTWAVWARSSETPSSSATFLVATYDAKMTSIQADGKASTAHKPMV